MAQTIVSVRMDSDIKKEFDEFCSDVGMNTSVAINLFVKTVLRERKIPFEISQNKDPFYSEVNTVRLKKAIEAFEEGNTKIISKSMGELEITENE